MLLQYLIYAHTVADLGALTVSGRANGWLGRHF